MNNSLIVQVGCCVIFLHDLVLWILVAVRWEQFNVRLVDENLEFEDFETGCVVNLHLMTVNYDRL